MHRLHTSPLEIETMKYNTLAVEFPHKVAITFTINREIFVYENIHVLNIRVNKFSRVPHENILT